MCLQTACWAVGPEYLLVDLVPDKDIYLWKQPASDIPYSGVNAQSESKYAVPIQELSCMDSNEEPMVLMSVATMVASRDPMKNRLRKKGTRQNRRYRRGGSEKIDTQIWPGV
jgi:hypothetical protein